MSKNMILNFKLDGVDESANGIKGLQDNVKILNKELESTEIGSDKFNELSKAIQASKEKLDSAKKSMKGLDDTSSKMGSSINESNKGFKGLGSISGGLKTQLAGVNASMMKLLANPVVPIIAAAVAVFMLLKKALAGSEEGQNKMAKASAMLSGFMAKLMDILEPIASFLIDVLIGAFEAVGNAITYTNGLIAESLSWLGLEGASNNLKKYNKELENVNKSISKISDDRAKAEVMERELIVERAKVEASIAEAKSIVNDRENYSAKERQDALKEAARLTDSLAEKEEARLVLLLEAIKLENSLGNSTKEAKKAEAELEASLFAIITKRANASKELKDGLRSVANEEVAIEKAKQDEIDAVNKTASDKRKAENARRIAETKARVDAEIAEEKRKQAEIFATEQAKILDEEKVSEDYRLRNLTKQQRELDDLNTKHTEELEMAKDNAELTAQLKAEYKLKEDEINTRYKLAAEEQAKIAEADRISKENEDKLKAIKAKEDEYHAKVAIVEQYTAKVNELSGLVFNIAETFGKQDEASKERRAKKQFQVQKAMSLSMAIIDGYKAITTSLAYSPLVVGTIPNPAGIKSLISTSITTAANIAKIAASKYSSSGSGGGSAPSSVSGGDSAPSSVPAPSANFFGTAGTESTSTNEQSDGTRQQSTHITVGVSEFTNTQNTMMRYSERSSLNDG